MPLPHDLPPQLSPPLTHLFRRRPAPFFLFNRSQSPHRRCRRPPPLPFLPSAVALAGPRCPLLFPAVSTTAKPSFAAALFSSSSSSPDSRCHLPSQPQPPPFAAPAPCFLYHCSRRNLLDHALLCHRGHLCSSPSLLTTPLPPLLPLIPSLPQPPSKAPLPLHLVATASPCCHRCPFLLSTSPARKNPATTSSSIAALSACCRSHFQSHHLPLQQPLPFPYDANSCP
ncbi:hypothetical protein B296_00035708 [Ensete ventricosum]|uniref:Uncharacterized protein n=1 Tax=Ensete ventricosum TaxID=4639 RepID=A0A426XMH2_ENSVE|nr:hypothetical protein B296_00035708 [Ensete ventricosum]